MEEKNFYKVMNEFYSFKQRLNIITFIEIFV